MVERSMSNRGEYLNAPGANLNDQAARLTARGGNLYELASKLDIRFAGPGARVNDGRRVNVLFAHRRSEYFSLPVNVWDERRDAMRWDGSGGPVIAHPPCRLWSRARGLSKADPAEMACGGLAVSAVRSKGGVLEHPAQSRLWHQFALPLPGKWDSFGFCLSVMQGAWGHAARKPTWLYVVGCRRCDVPEVPRLEMPVADYADVFDLTPDQRDLTPRAFAWWLEELASRCVAP